MNRISYLINRLKKPNARVRRDACEKLSWETKLPGDAILALKQAANDPDPQVAEAARRALSVHGQEAMASSLTAQSMSPPRPDYPWSWIGNLHPAHLLFLAMGLFMIFVSDDWMVSFFILLFLAGGFLLVGLDGRPKHQKIIEVWLELARQTRLRLDPGHAYIFGESVPPSIDGIYRGRRVSITKRVQLVSGYEGDIPAVYTCMKLTVKNNGDCRFSMGSKSFGEWLFKRRAAGSGDALFDKHFRFSGTPDTFLQRACTLIVSHPMLLDRPEGVVMLTDNALSWVSWSRPTIELKGYELVCLQSGIPTEVTDQVELLNLLCDLAELSEEMGRAQGTL